MTNINRRFFGELADCLRAGEASQPLIFQIADVLNRNCSHFKRDWFLAEAGYQPEHLSLRVLKLGNKMKIVPLHPSPESITADDEQSTTTVEEKQAVADFLTNAPRRGWLFDENGKEREMTPEEVARSYPAPKGWDQIEPGPEQSFAPNKEK